MKNIDNKTYIGKIKSFKGLFGFITSELGKTFFHKKQLTSFFYPQKGDEVQFQLEPSLIKKNEMVACEIILLKKAEKQLETITEEYIVGTVKWFNDSKEYGFIETNNGSDYFIHQSNLLNQTSISEGDIVVFQEKYKKGKLSAIKCQSFIDYLNDSSEGLSAFLQKYFLEVSVNHSNYHQIESVLQSNEINKEAKVIFMSYAFEKANRQYQYYILQEGLVFLSQEEQTEFLQKFLIGIQYIGYMYHTPNDYDTVRSISRFEQIDETVKAIFLKSAFAISDTKCQYKMLFEDCLIDIEKETSDSQIELLQEIGRLDIEKIESILQSNKITEIAKEAFLKSAFETTDTESQYKMLFEDCLIDIEKETSDSQVELLQKIGKLDIEKIESILQSNKITETAKEAFLKSAFEKLSAENQYRILFEDCLIDIEKETTENQIELLQKIGRLDIEKIESILQSNKITETAKEAFLKSAFEKLSAENQYRILFEDCLIDIEKETTENQIELLQKLGQLDIDRIKYIAQTSKLFEPAKKMFLKSAFEKASTDCRYKMLFEDFLIDIENETSESQIELLQELGKLNLQKIRYIAQTDKIPNTIKTTFLKSVFKVVSTEYQYIMLIDGLLFLSIEEQTEFTQKYLIEICNRVYANYEQIKSIAQSDKIHNIVKAIFIPAVFEKFELRSKHNMLFKDNLIEYSQVSKIDRLRLWLEGLNPHYDYLEYVQTIWQLSKSERRLFNKRVKQQARNERLQQFIDKIPSAKVIKETEDTITYKCKWRNLYYKNGSIQVFLDKITSTEDYLWESAREQWNLLTQEYFNNRRIDDIIVTVKNNHVIQITGLEDIETKIVIAEIRKNGTANKRTSISSSEFLRLIHNVSARNQCINFLASQNSDYNVIDIQELITNEYGAYTRDISFLFPIPNGNGSVYLIWESAEFEKSKATHIFKCSEEEFEETERKIKEFIESNIRIRSRLNSSEYDNREIQKDLQHLCKVNHDSVEYQIWEDRMKEVLPFLN